MSKRIWLAGILGGLAMFIWTFIAHMAMPLGQAGVQQIENEQPLLAAMQSTLNAPGLFLFPRMTPGADQARYQQQIATGPSGMLVYFPKRDFAFGKLVAVEFVKELLEALIAVYLLSLTRLGSFAGRVGFCALIGLIAAIATNLSYWNWYGFPTAYTVSYMLMGWVGYVCVGLVAAGMKIGGSTGAPTAA